MSTVIPRFDFRVQHAVSEDVGRWQHHNEDAHLIAPGLSLFAVADGMGGHAAGEVAARLAIEQVRDSVAGSTSQKVADAYAARPDLDTRRALFTRLRRAIERANERVRSEALHLSERVGMGTTLDVVWLTRDYAFVAHAGDGRVYLSRSNATLQLTQDHAQLETLKALGKLRPQTKQRGANQLLNAVGLTEQVAVDNLFVNLHTGDRLLICSDGIHGQIASEARLGELLRRGTTQDAADALIREAAEQGRDNATALVIEIGERFVRRDAEDRGLAAEDIHRARQSELLNELPLPRVLEALSAGVQVELPVGALVARVVASDLVAYIVLDGVVRWGHRHVGTGATLFGESLVGVWGEGELPMVQQTARLLRVRADDFQEVCAADPILAAELYQRLALHLARRHVASVLGSRPPRSS